MSVVSLLTTACTKEQAVQNDEADMPITFVTASYQPRTKASFIDDSFHVSAWTTGGVRYMNDVEVSRSGADVWATTTAYYWPKADSLSFVGTHGRVSGSPWAAVNDGCTELSTGVSDIVFHPVVDSDTASHWLYTDRTAKYNYQSGSVPIVFRNGLASVAANVVMRMGDDVIRTDAEGKYRIYDTLSTGNKTYYVVPFGFSPNGDLPPHAYFPIYPEHPYPVKVKLTNKITHIWRIVAHEIKSYQVGNTGRLTMTAAPDGSWTKPASEVWTIPDNLAAHPDSVVLYDETVQGDLAGTPIPANLNDFQCPVSESFLVMPQNLNWSSSSNINNPRTEVSMTVEVYNEDINQDGIFDYRDVYKYWVVEARDGTGRVTDSTLVSDASTAASHKNKEFYKWYEWDGTGSSVLRKVHDYYHYVVNPQYKARGISVPEVTFCQILENLRPHLKYPLETKITLAKISTSEETKYWKMNKRTTYNIIFSPVTNEITFSPEVSEWVDEGNVSAR